jgi:hypothetical protein
MHRLQRVASCFARCGLLAVIALGGNWIAATQTTNHPDPGRGGSVWVANKGNKNVTRILGVGASAAPLSTAAANKTTGAKP